LNNLFFCSQCGYESPKWLGRCPACGEWNTFTEAPVRSVPRKQNVRAGKVDATAKSLGSANTRTITRVSTGIAGLDRLLGGGIVQGELILVGGPPGIGKSTLLLQIAASVAKSLSQPVLYVSGEESTGQVSLRAGRLGINEEKLLCMNESETGVILGEIERLSPSLLVVDSIQTTYDARLPQPPGSPVQIRQCAQELLDACKSSGFATMISAHVTKEGSIAGPKLLEHVVDCVLYFETARHDIYRILRCYKNRFGATSEVAMFEMGEFGLKEVPNLSGMLLEHRSRTPGSAIVIPVEGSQPIMVELQALVNRTSLGYPRRQSSGVDYNRLILLLAVMENHLGIELSQYDVFLNLAGGIKVYEPACDLGAVLAIYSAIKKKQIDASAVFIGEVGLGGEVRSVPLLGRRVEEAERFGFRRAIIPSQPVDSTIGKGGIEINPVSSVIEAVKII